MGVYLDGTGLETILSVLKQWIEARPSGGGATGADYIVEQGTSGMWTYEKWNSGKLIQYGNTSYNGKLNNSQAGGYSSASLSIDDYPVTFIESPVITNGVYCANDSAAFVAIYPSTTPTTGIGHYRLWRGNSQGTTYTYTVSFEARGRWK